MSVLGIVLYDGTIPAIDGREARILVDDGSTEFYATLRQSGKQYFTNVNTPGRDLTLQDFTAQRVLRNAGVGSTPLLLRPMAFWTKSPTDSSSAGLATPAIGDDKKFVLELAREWEGFFSVNPYAPTNFGTVANNAAMVGLTSAKKYDYCTNTAAGGVRILMTEPYSVAANWVDLATSGLPAAGTPRVDIDWGPQAANDPNGLAIGHIPVKLRYFNTAAGVEYWSAR